MSTYKLPEVTEQELVLLLVALRQLDCEFIPDVAAQAVALEKKLMQEHMDKRHQLWLAQMQLHQTQCETQLAEILRLMHATGIP